MTEGLKLEDWIGKRVTVNVYAVAEVRHRKTVYEGAEVLSSPETPSEKQIVVGVTGSLEGVDSAGIIVLYDPRDLATSRGPLTSADPENTPRYALIPWHRVSVVERIEAGGVEPEPE